MSGACSTHMCVIKGIRIISMFLYQCETDMWCGEGTNYCLIFFFYPGENASIVSPKQDGPRYPF